LRRSKEDVFELPLIDAEVVDVKLVVSGNLLEIILYKHRHSIDKIFCFPQLVYHSLDCDLCILGGRSEVELHEHLPLVIEVPLMLLSVNQLLQVLMLL
jgi:hypothetical protein